MCRISPHLLRFGLERVKVTLTGNELNLNACYFLITNVQSNVTPMFDRSQKINIAA